MFKRSYKFRLYPTEAQIEVLNFTLRRCRELYNGSLTEWREAYRMCGISIQYQDQQNQLPDIKEWRPEYKDIYSQVLQDVLNRRDKASKAFYRRVKNGETPGYPRYKSQDRYNSFTYPQSGWSLNNTRLTLSKIGNIRIRLHREMVGKVKTVTIKREGSLWYAIFSVEAETPPLPPNDKTVGIDLGINLLAALSTGETVANPHWFKQAADKLKLKQQQLARHKLGSKRRAEIKRQVVNLHHHIANQRKDFNHKLSRQWVDRFGTIVFEDLQIANMVRKPKPKKGDAMAGEPEYLPNGAAAKRGLNREILSAGWGMLQQYCVGKAESAGRCVLFVSPQNTSRRCSSCGYTDKNNRLTQADFFCLNCGKGMNADINAAKNIEWLGSSQRGNLRIASQMPRPLGLRYFTN